MKQSKRLLSVLLAMLLIFSTFTIGVSAYKTSYEEPAGYDSIYEPYFTNDQAASALLDYLDDEVFSSMDVDEDLVVVEIHIHSFDTFADSLTDIFNNWLVKIGEFVLDLGDIEDLNLDIIMDTSNRRRNGSMSDFQLFIKICQWLSIEDNASVVSKLVEGTLDLGLIDNFFNLYDEVPLLKNLHGYVCNMLYELLYPDQAPTGYVEGASDSYVLDDIVQNFLDHELISFIFNLLDPEDVETALSYVSLPLQFDENRKIINHLGLLDVLPSLQAKYTETGVNPISITDPRNSTYDFFINIVMALVDDILVPSGGALILSLLDVEPDDYDAEESSYIDIAINLFVDYNTLVEAGAVSPDTPEESVNVVEEFLRWKGVENPERPKPIDKINVALEYILKVGIKKYIHFVCKEELPDGRRDSQLQLTPYFAGMFSDIIRMVLPMLPSLVDDFAPLTAEQNAAIETMGDEELFAFGIKMVLDAFVDGVYFPENCTSIKSLATYTLINVCEELVHDENADFQAMVDNFLAGSTDPNASLNPNADVYDPNNPDLKNCLSVGASVLNYYLVGQTTFEGVKHNGVVTLTPTFDELLDGCFETFVGKYAALFSMFQSSAEKAQYGNNAWYKLYKSVNQWIPLTNIFYGVSDDWQGLKQLLMGSIIENVLNFDIGGVLGIIGRRTDSDLNKPLSQLLANLIARVLNGVFKLPTEVQNQAGNASFQLNNLIVPYDYTRLDQILVTKINTSTAGYTASIANCGLKNTARMLLKSLPNITQEGAVAAESLDIIAELIGIIDLDNFAYIKRQFAREFPADQSYTINELKSLYNELRIPDNEGIKYYEDNYTFSHTVDYDPWTYSNFKDALGNASDIITAFDNGESVKRADITYAYYLLDHTYNDFLLPNQPAANNFYLNRVITNNPRITSNDDGSGNKLYTSRSWSDYNNAYDFALKVMNEYNTAANRGALGDYHQSKVNTARRELLDAIKGLKLDAGLGDADYSELERQINNLRLLPSPATYTDKSVDAVIAAYNEALAFFNEVHYDADYQVTVDNIVSKLTKAYELLVTIPILDVYDPDYRLFYTDEVNSYLFGLADPLFTEQDESDFGDFYTYMDAWLWGYPTGGEAYVSWLELVPTENGNGTGSKIQLQSDDDGDGIYKTEREYTVIYFGDVNGDGSIDGMDSVIIKTYAARLNTINANTQYIAFAGDVDCDDFLSTEDASIIANYGVGKNDRYHPITQTPEARLNGSTISFTDLVDGVLA